MKNKLLRITCALFVFCLLLAFMPLAVSADDTRTWELKKDLSSITDGKTVYTVYEPPSDAEWLPTKTLYCYDTTDIEAGDLNTSYFELSTVSKDSGILHLQVSFEEIFMYYVSDTAREKLIEFENEQNVSYRLSRSPDRLFQSTLTAETVTELKALTPTEEVDVTTLNDVEYCHVGYYDSTGSFYREIGRLFFFGDGSVGYVNYTHLNNTHFDAHGNLSFRTGTAPICMIGGATLLTDIQDAKANFKDLSPQITYEFYETYWQMMRLVSVPLFWTLFAITGAILPAVGLTLGIVWARSPKQKHPRRWYVLVGLCGLWLLLTLIIFLMMVI